MTSGKKKTILFSVLAVILVTLMIKTCTEMQGIEKRGVYVIGKVQKVRGAYQGRRVNMTYRYRNQSFTADFVTSEIYMNEKGRRYFLRIDTLHLNKFKVFYHIIVPDSITEAPEKGWNKLPVVSY